MSATPLLLPPPPSPPRKRSRVKLVVLMILSALALIVVLLNLGKESYIEYRLASAGVDRFHQHLNAADYEAIFADASDSFRRSGHAEWTGYFQKAHLKMGNSGKRSTIAFYKYRRGGWTWVDEVVDTQFANGEAHERFVWLRERDKLKLYWYRIDSPNLR